MSFKSKVMKPADQRGWWGFPLLALLCRWLGWDSPSENWWRVVTYDLADGLAEHLSLIWGELEPAMITLKDGAVHVLYLQHKDGRTVDLRSFRYLAGLGYTLRRGLQVMSKRWSRFWRYIGLWATMRGLVVAPITDHKAYEGILILRRAEIMPRMYRALKARGVPHLRRLMRQLAQADSFEVTLQGPEFQLKGEGHWGDPRTADGVRVDVGYLAGEEKRELVFFWGDDEWLLTLIPRNHKERSEAFDIQLIANEMRWLTPRRLVSYLRAAMVELLERIQSGDLLGVLGTFGGFDTEDLIRYDERRKLGISPAYPPVRLAMGAPKGANTLMWFPAFARQMAAEALRKWGLYHIPIRNGDGFKVLPDVSVPQGKVRFQRKLDKHGKPTNHYKSVVLMHPDTVVNLYAACDSGDGDDIYLLLLFTCRGRYYLKAVRRPAMIGQGFRLGLDGWRPPQWDCPKVNSLADVFPTFKVEYPELNKIAPDVRFTGDHEEPWEDVLTTERAVWEIKRAQGNVALVGSYANTIMVMAAIMGRLLPKMPITMSDLIDIVQMGKFMLGSMKPIRDFMRAFWQSLVDQHVPLSRFFEQCVPERYRPDVNWDESRDNPFNELMAGIDATIKWYEHEIDVLALKAKPPMLPGGDEVWGRQLITAYRNEWRQIHLESDDDGVRHYDDEANKLVMDAIMEERRVRVHNAVMAVLGQLPRETQYSAILSAYNLVMAEGPVVEGKTVHYRDALFTMAGPKHNSGVGRYEGLSDLLIEALIHCGLLHDLEEVPDGEAGTPSHVERAELKPMPAGAGRISLRVRGWGNMMAEAGHEDLCLPLVKREQSLLTERTDIPGRMFPGDRVAFGLHPWRGVERLALYAVVNVDGGGQSLRRFGLVVPEHESLVDPARDYQLRWLTLDGHSLLVSVEPK